MGAGRAERHGGPRGPSAQAPRLLVAVATCAAAFACLPPAGAAGEALRAEAVLPPGNSGFVSIAGLPSGTGSPHLTDQHQLFIDFELRPFGFSQGGSSISPKPGVTISRDSYGIPRIDAASDADAWWGVGYAAGEDRLFQLELFRRAGNGTLAEILGRGFLDDDLIARRDYYTDAEMEEMMAPISARLRARLDAYRDGINAYVETLAARPRETPGEFVALGVPVTPFDSIELARVGVLLARTVPSGDGNELENAKALRRIGRRSFDFLHPVRTKGRIPTIKRREGVFKSQPHRTRRQERRAFGRTIRWLETIDVDGAGGMGSVPSSDAEQMIAPERGKEPGEGLRRILPAGGSFMWAIRDERRKRGYLFNGPQLDYSIPELFYEFELHSPTQAVRGVSAAGIPLIGIGHNDEVAWGFTSGLSDEDDLFAVELVDDETYVFRGEERAMSCRDETFVFRAPPPDLPGITDPSDASGETTERICRTVHGPVQARGDGVAFARRYAIWKRELESIVGLSALNDARTIHDVDRAMDQVTWNENVIATDSRGRIGFWHPGLHQLRAPGWDERLPNPGDGRAEWRGLLPKSQRPRVINPKRGWVANWNNVPSHGWTNGDGPARERLSGDLHRVRILERRVRRVARNPSYARSRAIELRTGTAAQQFPFRNKRRLGNAERRFASPAGAAALRELRRWNGDYHRSDDEGTVHAGLAIWEELKEQLEARMLRRHGGDDARPLAGSRGSSHEFDITNGEAIALRTVGPRGYARAAERTAEALGERFGSSDPSRWREPRRMYDVAPMGAGSAPPLPFFDRGTWSQSLVMG